MKLSELKVLYRRWVSGYRDNVIGATWKEYARYELMRSRLEEAEKLLEEVFDGMNPDNLNPKELVRTSLSVALVQRAKKFLGGAA